MRKTLTLSSDAASASRQMGIEPKWETIYKLDPEPR